GTGGTVRMDNFEMRGSESCSYDASTAVTGEATGADNCDAGPVVTYSDVETPGACPSNFTITRTWVVTDACGNSLAQDQIIEVEDDKVPQLASVADCETLDQGAINSCLAAAEAFDPTTLE